MKTKYSLPFLFSLALIIGCGKSEEEINGELENINSSIAGKLEKPVVKHIGEGKFMGFTYLPEGYETGDETIAQNILSDSSAPLWAKGLSNYGVISYTAVAVGTGAGVQTRAAQRNRLFLGYDGENWKYIGTEFTGTVAIKLQYDKPAVMGETKTKFVFDLHHLGGDLVKSAISEAAQN